MKKQGILQVVDRHIRRVLPKNWWKKATDNRRQGKCTRWSAQTLLEMLFTGALTGSKTLRDIETISELYQERIPDTTLHDFMQRVDPEGLRVVLAQGVKHALAAHELDQDFPVRITAIDGKALYTTSRQVNDSSDLITGDGEGSYRHMALRAMLVSSPTEMLLGQYELPQKSHEMRALLPFVDQLQQLYGRCSLLQVLSMDAGMTSRGNAQGIRDRGLHYLMAVKGNQRSLLPQVKALLATKAAPDAMTEETQNGARIQRTVTSVAIEGLEGWQHARGLWRIDQCRTHLATGEVEEETRFFITSLPHHTLTACQILAAIRMHWHIENTANWNLDVHWQEDSSPWTSGAMVLVALLRMMAFNLINRLKTRKLHAKVHRKLAWRDLFRYFEHALCRFQPFAFLGDVEAPANG